MQGLHDVITITLGMLQSNDIDEIFGHPEVNLKIDELKAMDADWFTIRDKALAEVKTRAFTKEQGIRIALQIFSRAVTKCQGGREPKQWGGKILKFFANIFK